MCDSAQARVLCFGNPLHGDDGFGYAVYEGLLPFAGDLGAELHFVGTGGLAALTWFEGCRELLLVDALEAGTRRAREGLAELTPEDLVPEVEELSGHSQGLYFLTRAMGCLELASPPRVRVLAALCQGTQGFQLELGPEVARTVLWVIAWIRGQYFSQKSGQERGGHAERD